MSREILVGAVSAAAAECGYGFYTGPEYRMDAEIASTPALWLLPAHLEKTEGLNEGVRHYKTTIKFIRDCTDNSPQAKEKLWTSMEGDAAAFCLALCGHERIKSATGLQYAPAEFSLTNRGELSLSVTLDVQVPFFLND